MDCQKNSLELRNLRIGFMDYAKRETQAVKGLNLTLPKGKIVALVGESGCGKTVTSLAIMNLLKENATVSGEIYCNGKSIHKMSTKQRQSCNGRLFGMIFQEPVGALDPLFIIKKQMMEGLRKHRKVSKTEGIEIICEGLQNMNFQAPAEILNKYPHELSGGMCQRVMIASVLIQEVEYLIADEPTTALDVTIQKQLLIQLYKLSREKNIGILFITHDLAAVAEIADYIYVMKDGELVEEGDVFEVFDKPKNEYTRHLIAGKI